MHTNQKICIFRFLVFCFWKSKTKGHLICRLGWIASLHTSCLLPAFSWFEPSLIAHIPVLMHCKWITSIVKDKKFLILSFVWDLIQFRISLLLFFFFTLLEKIQLNVHYIKIWKKKSDWVEGFCIVSIHIMTLMYDT
jgi:hypothetical protein